MKEFFAQIWYSVRRTLGISRIRHYEFFCQELADEPQLESIIEDLLDSYSMVYSYAGSLGEVNLGLNEFTLQLPEVKRIVRKAGFTIQRLREVES